MHPGQRKYRFLQCKMFILQIKVYVHVHVHLYSGRYENVWITVAIIVFPVGSVFKQWQHVGVSICLQFGLLSLAVMIWQKSQWTQTETDYTVLMPDNKDCKNTRGSFQSGYDTESAKSLSDICPESIQSVQLLKGEKKCHLECWMLELFLRLEEHNMFVMNSHHL